METGNAEEMTNVTVKFTVSPEWFARRDYMASLIKDGQARMPICGVDELKERSCEKRSDVPTGKDDIHLRCYADEEENPYYAKDDDLSQIWLLELYFRECTVPKMAEARWRLDNGSCAKEIQEADVSYSAKLQATVLEYAKDELEKRLAGPGEPWEDSMPITEDDCFYPFANQWMEGTFPWKRYLSLPILAPKNV